MEKKFYDYLEEARSYVVNEIAYKSNKGDGVKVTISKFDDTDAKVLSDLIKETKGTFITVSTPLMEKDKRAAFMSKVKKNVGSKVKFFYNLENGQESRKINITIEK
jgi:hypothetical protein